MLMIECSHCPGTICPVCSHSDMLMIECSHCPGTICTVINVLTVTCWWLSVATDHQHVTVRTLITVHMVPEQWLHSINMSLSEHTVHMEPGQWLLSIINMSLWEHTDCPGTICTVINVLTVTCWWLSVATVVRTYCTYDTRTVATLNHQHVTVRTLITVHMVPGQRLHSIIYMSLWEH
jgi:hypothetical protein